MPDFSQSLPKVKPLWQTQSPSPGDFASDLEPGGDKPSTIPIQSAPIPPRESAGSDAVRSAYDRYRSDPSPEAADEFLRAIRPWMASAVRAFAGPDAPPSVWAHAKRIALEAAPRFDPRQKTQFRTYLMTHWQGLRRIAARSATPIRVPEQAAIDAGRLAAHEADLAAQLGRPPSDAELADHTGLSLPRIANARRASGFLSESSAGENRMDAGLTRLSPAERMAWIRFVYADLSPIDQVILEHSVGLNNKPIRTTQELAKQLRMSAGAVSQRKTRIEQLLAEATSLGQMQSG